MLGAGAGGLFLAGLGLALVEASVLGFPWEGSAATALGPGKAGEATSTLPSLPKPGCAHLAFADAVCDLLPEWSSTEEVASSPGVLQSTNALLEGCEVNRRCPPLARS